MGGQTIFELVMVGLFFGFIFLSLWVLNNIEMVMVVGMLSFWVISLVCWAWGTLTRPRVTAEPSRVNREVEDDG